MRMLTLTFIFAAALITLGTFLTVAETAVASPTATITVNSTGDEADASGGTGSCATAGGACTLRAAIQRVVPDLPLAVWEAAGEAWRTSRDLDSALARIRGLDELAQGVNEQFSAASAFRRNTLLFVITALSLLSLIPVAGDFATNPDDSVDNLLRLGVALAVVLIAMLALGATLWMTRADRRRPPVE